MSFDARHHANEPASGKPDLTRRGFLAGAAATGALGVIGVNLFVRQGFDPGGVANASRQKRLRSQVLPAVRGQILDINDGLESIEPCKTAAGTVLLKPFCGVLL